MSSNGRPSTMPPAHHNTIIRHEIHVSQHRWFPRLLLEVTSRIRELKQSVCRSTYACICIVYCVIQQPTKNGCPPLGEQWSQRAAEAWLRNQRCAAANSPCPAIRKTLIRHKFLYPSTGGFLGCCWRLPPGYMNYNTASVEAHEHADV